MTAKTISVRLEPDDVHRLVTEAGKLGVAPGTFARVLIKAGLDAPRPAGAYSRAARLRARDQFVRASWPQVVAVDSVALVRDARDELEERSEFAGGLTRADPGR